MKKLTIALILSIFIHILFLLNYNVPKEENSAQNQNKEKNIASNIRMVKLKAAPAVEQKEVLTPPKVEEPFKKVEKIKPQPKREVVKEAKKTVTKPTTSQQVQPTFTHPLPKEKPKTPLEKEQEKLKKETLSDFLPTPELDRNMLDTITQSYLELYGEEYNSFNKVQKVFLQKNLRDIGRITQKYLRYPSLAARLRQDGTNIVEFMLYPNGDISDLRLTSSSHSTSLDENTLETIRIAYKDYPRPKEPTKIKIYVNYFLY
ncbi:MAG: TonB family protein [Arcobacteraceae bacterium]|nr:TonB family protein [Arcobacteraceae bacterium]